MILKELKVLTGFIIEGHNFNSITYAINIVLMADTERKLRKSIEKIVMEGENKELSLNRKRAKFMFISKTNNAG